MNDEWQARLAVWQGDWTRVRKFVDGATVQERIRATFGDDPERGMYRSVLILGVYTSFGLEHENLEAVKACWRASLPLIEAFAPGYRDVLKDYFDSSVVRFGKAEGLAIDHAEFGFAERTSPQ